MTQRSPFSSSLTGGIIGALIGLVLGSAVGSRALLRGDLWAEFVIILCIGIGILVFGVLGSVLGFLDAIARRREANQAKDICLFPASEEIRAIRIKSWRPDPQKEEVEFVVPQECWEAFLSMLSDAQRDPHPFKWETLAELVIHTTDGQAIAVALCNLPNYPLGAFFVTGNRHRYDCYRGGSTALFNQVLAAAWAASNPGE